MGNAILSRAHHGHVKIMKLDGQVMKIKAPVTVHEILADYPGYVILHSEAVRHMGVKAKPLDESTTLNTKHLYFLVELPKVENYERGPRRVRSGIAMNAKSRLESMLLKRRSISDISPLNFGASSDSSASVISEDNGGHVRVKVRIKKDELIAMIAQSKDSSETAERILECCRLNSRKSEQLESGNAEKDEEEKGDNLVWKPSLGSIPETCRNPQVNQVRFRSAPNQDVF